MQATPAMRYPQLATSAHDRANSQSRLNTDFKYAIASRVRLQPTRSDFQLVMAPMNWAQTEPKHSVNDRPNPNEWTNESPSSAFAATDTPPVTIRDSTK